MTWYAAAGDPRWDADELWTAMGHLFKGGMWFKKKANISGFSDNTAYNGRDWRTNSDNGDWSASQTLPDAAEIGNYFYLPALGYYYSGQLAYVGSGYYWSSSVSTWDNDHAYGLTFSSGHVLVYTYRCKSGFRAEALQ